MLRLAVLVFCILSVFLMQTAIASADSDGDGYPDWMEQLCGTNPNQPDRPSKDQIINAVTQKVIEYFSSPPEQRQEIIDQVVQLVIAYFNLPSEELLTSQTVSYSGGSITTQDFTVNIQSGTFSSNTEVRLYKVYENPFGDNAISDGYKIEFSQLPSKPVEIRVKCSKTPNGETLIAVGGLTFVKSIGEETETYLLLPATVSNGYATVELPSATVSSSISATSLKSGSTGYSFDLWAITGYAKYETKHFRIYFPSSLAYTSAIEDLGDALENAYDTYKRMGFDYSVRTNWPMTVTVKKLKSDVYGYYSSSIFGVNHGTIEINEDKINDIDELRITAGHEFFHFVQDLYDPRSSISKAKGWFYTHYWLDEATAVWAEEKFASTSSYISPTRQGNENAPLKGMHAGSQSNAKDHGYGMSAMIKYLVDQYGESVLVDIYNQIKAGKHPIDAIWYAVGDPADWYADFLKDYTLGYLYGDFSPLSELSGKFTISSDKDTYKSFVESYPDLSGKFFLIKLNYPDMSQNTEMTIKVNGSLSYITVFKVKSGSIQFFDSNYDQITISNLKQLQDGGWNLLVLVTNTREIYPYTGSRSITLEVNITIPTEGGEFHLSQINSARIKVSVYLKGSSYPYPIDSWYWDCSGGSFSGYTFTCTDTGDVLGIPSTVNVVVKIDPSLTKVVNFTASEVWQESCLDTDAFEWREQEQFIIAFGGDLEIDGLIVDSKYYRSSTDAPGGVVNELDAGGKNKATLKERLSWACTENVDVSTPEDYNIYVDIYLCDSSERCQAHVGW